MYDQPFAIGNTSTPTTSSTTSTTSSTATSSSTTSSSSSSSSSSSTTPRARTREEDVFEFIITEAANCVGMVTPYIRQEIAGWLSMVEPQVVLYAIHQTAMAPRPAWRYTHAILLRCRRDGVTGKAAAIEDELLYSGMVGTHAASPGRALGQLHNVADPGDMPY